MTPLEADDNTDGVNTDDENLSNAGGHDNARDQPSLQAINEVESNHDTIHVKQDSRKVKRRNNEMKVEENAAINE